MNKANAFIFLIFIVCFSGFGGDVFAGAPNEKNKSSSPSLQLLYLDTGNKWADKSLRYSIRRELGLERDSLWHYKLKHNNLSLHKRVSYNMIDANIIDIDILGNLKIRSVNLSIVDSLNHKELIIIGGPVHMSDSNGRNIVRLNIGVKLKHYFPKEKSKLFLKQIAVFMAVDATYVIDKNPIKSLKIYSLAGNKVSVSKSMEGDLDENELSVFKESDNDIYITNLLVGKYEYTMAHDYYKVLAVLLIVLALLFSQISIVNNSKYYSWSLIINKWLLSLFYFVVSIVFLAIWVEYLIYGNPTISYAGLMFSIFSILVVFGACCHVLANLMFKEYRPVLFLVRLALFALTIGCVIFSPGYYVFVGESWWGLLPILGSLFLLLPEIYNKAYQAWDKQSYFYKSLAPITVLYILSLILTSTQDDGFYRVFSGVALALTLRFNMLVFQQSIKKYSPRGASIIFNDEGNVYFFIAFILLIFTFMFLFFDGISAANRVASIIYYCLMFGLVEIIVKLKLRRFT
jgi:hypothetical protein